MKIIGFDCLIDVYTNSKMQTSLTEIIEKDLELMWYIRRYCKSKPWIQNTLGIVVSKYPMRDIILLVWLLFIIGLFEIGQRHFWIISMNITAIMCKINNQYFFLSSLISPDSITTLD
jgi:hypothetical protein